MKGRKRTDMNCWRDACFGHTNHLLVRCLSTEGDERVHGGCERASERARDHKAREREENSLTGRLRRETDRRIPGCSTLFPPWSLNGLYIEILQRGQPTPFLPRPRWVSWSFLFFSPFSNFFRIPTYLTYFYSTQRFTCHCCCSVCADCSRCLWPWFVLFELCICVYVIRCTYHTFVGQIRVGNCDG